MRGRPGRRLNAELTASLGVTIAVSLPPALTGAMATEILRDHGVGHASFGAAVSTYFVLQTLLSPAAGRLVDRLGPVVSLRLAVVLLMACLVGVGSFGNTYGLFVIAMSIGGLGSALAVPVASVLLAAAGPLRMQPLLFGVRQAVVPAASLAGGLVILVVAGSSHSWRLTFLVPGILLGLLLVPGQYGERTADPGKRVGGGREFQTHELWMIAGAMALSGAAANAVITFVVDYASSIGANSDFGGLTLVVASAAAVMTRILVGYLAGRVQVDPLLVINLMLVGGAAGFLTVLLGPSAAVMPGMALGVGGAWGWSGLALFVITFGSGTRPARANGIVNAGGAAGGIIGPVLTGLAIQRSSYQAAWVIAALCIMSGAGIMCALILKRRRLRRRALLR